MKPDIGECDKCRQTFDYQIIHNGFGDTAYAYCDSCGMTTFVGGWDDTRRPADAPLKIHGPIHPETEAWLQRCTCGGRFRHNAEPRCPHCHERLSAEAATSYIERNAEGTRGGWRWQRSWSGIYCLIIAGRSTKNNWREPAEHVANAGQTPVEASAATAPGQGVVRVLLRGVALLSALSVLLTAAFLVRFGSRGIAALHATGIFGMVTLLGWLITFIAGPIAAVQLFRLRQSGRIAAAVLFATMLVYYVVGLLAFRQPGAPRLHVVALSAFLCALLTIVLSPAARRACSSKP